MCFVIGEDTKEPQNTARHHCGQAQRVDRNVQTLRRIWYWFYTTTQTASAHRIPQRTKSTALTLPPVLAALRALSFPFGRSGVRNGVDMRNQATPCFDRHTHERLQSGGEKREDVITVWRIQISSVEEVPHVQEPTKM